MTVVLTIALITLGQAPLASTFTLLLITIIGPTLLLIVKLNHRLYYCRFTVVIREPRYGNRSGPQRAVTHKLHSDAAASPISTADTDGCGLHAW